MHMAELQEGGQVTGCEHSECGTPYCPLCGEAVSQDPVIIGLMQIRKRFESERSRALKQVTNAGEERRGTMQVNSYRRKDADLDMAIQTGTKSARTLHKRVEILTSAIERLRGLDT